MAVVSVFVRVRAISPVVPLTNDVVKVNAVAGEIVLWRAVARIEPLVMSTAENPESWANRVCENAAPRSMFKSW